MILLILLVVLAADSSLPPVPAGVTVGVTLTAMMGAVLATARYIKRTEDDTVDGLRERVGELEAGWKACIEAENAARDERRLLHSQIDFLFRKIREAKIQVDLTGFPTE